MANEFIPRPQLAFRGWANNFVQKISLDPARYSVSTELAAAGALALHAFNASLSRALSPETRTKPANTAKDDSRFELEKLIRQMANRVRADKTVTPAMRIELGLPQRNSGGHHARNGAPSDQPLLIATPAVGRDVNIQLIDLSSNRVARPRGVNTAIIRSCVGSNPSDDFATWRYETTVTRCRSRLTLRNSDIAPGETVWLCARWHSTRGAAGPFSRAVSVMLNLGMFATNGIPALAR